MTITKENLSALELAKLLLSRPSITPDDAGCQSIIKENLHPYGFHFESMRFNDVDNLWAKFGSESPLFVFAGHTDVVPTGPLSDWTFPPFEPTEHNDYLYGRGTSDMKCAIAAMITAAKNFLHAHSDFKGSIGFLITSDEEGPSINGTKKVIETLEKRGEKIDYCIVGEPSSDKIIGDQIRIGRRGSLHGKLTIKGKQGHVANPYLAINPIHQSMQAFHEIAHTEWDQGNDQFPPTTLQFTNIHSGTGALNVIPGHLECSFNLRFSPVSNPIDLQNRIEAILKKHHLNFTIDWTISANPFLSRQGKLIQAAQKSIQEINGLSVNLSTGGGTSDARFIAPTGAEVIELGVLNETAHQIDEKVKISDIDKLTQMYIKILELVLLSHY
jgi:succinyl-diaminopimelate desuccinylase